MGDIAIRFLDGIAYLFIGINFFIPNMRVIDWFIVMSLPILPAWFLAKVGVSLWHSEFPDEEVYTGPDFNSDFRGLTIFFSVLMLCFLGIYWLAGVLP